MNKLIYISSFLLLSLLSCKKEKGNEPLQAVSGIPEITSVSVSTTSINQFNDLLINVNYIDGNGDLGTTDADVKSIFVTDSRDNTIIHEFHLQPLAPVGQSIAIQGALNITIENIILLSQSNNSETVSFSIYIADRAGSISNTGQTSIITIIK
jgi:hypothetical protein